MVQTIFVLRIFLNLTRVRFEFLVSRAEARVDFRFQMSGVGFQAPVSDL